MLDRPRHKSGKVFGGELKISCHPGRTGIARRTKHLWPATFVRQFPYQGMLPATASNNQNFHVIKGYPMRDQSQFFQSGTLKKLALITPLYQGVEFHAGIEGAQE
jgi:hypothetical protein